LFSWMNWFAFSPVPFPRPAPARQAPPEEPAPLYDIRTLWGAAPRRPAQALRSPLRTQDRGPTTRHHGPGPGLTAPAWQDRRPRPLPPRPPPLRLWPATRPRAAEAPPYLPDPGRRGPPGSPGGAGARGAG